MEELYSKTSPLSIDLYWYRMALFGDLITHSDELYKIEPLSLGSELAPFLVFSFFKPYKEAVIKAGKQRI